MRATKLSVETRFMVSSFSTVGVMLVRENRTPRGEQKSNTIDRVIGHVFPVSLMACVMKPVEMIMIRLHSSTRIFLLRFINIPQQQSLDQA
jgi:hypothetical protein